MKRKKLIFGIIGGVLIAFAVVGFILHALLQIKAGHGTGYRDHRRQWVNYLGALATLGIAALVGLIGLYYRVRRFLQKKRSVRA